MTDRILGMSLGSMREALALEALASPEDRAAFRALSSGDDPRPRSEPRYEVEDGVAVHHFAGIIEKTPSFLGWLYGSIILSDVVTQWRAAYSDDAVEEMHFHVDTPGGFTAGLTDALDELRGMLGKPVKIFTGRLESCGFWLFGGLGPQVEIIASDLATVGAVGVYVSHGRDDGSVLHIAAEQSPDKVPDLENDAHVEQLRAVCTEQCEIFIQDVAIGRGVSVETVKATFGAGRSLPASEALEYGLVDAVPRQNMPEDRRGTKAMDETEDKGAEELREENAQLQAEISRLKAELAELKKEPEEAEEPAAVEDPEEDPKVAALRDEVANLKAEQNKLAEERKQANATAWADKQIEREAVAADDVTYAALVEAHIFAADGVSDRGLKAFEALPDGHASTRTGAPGTTGGGAKRNGGDGYLALREELLKKAEANGTTYADELKAFRRAQPAAYAAAKESN